MYLKIPENVMGLILPDVSLFMYIPFVSKVKFQFLAQFQGHILSSLYCVKFLNLFFVLVRRIR